MNGRVYDPQVGAFLSPDPFVQAPYNTQSYNRYAYVFNNPMKYVDPSGYRLEAAFEDEARRGGGGGGNYYSSLMGLYDLNRNHAAGNWADQYGGYGSSATGMASQANYLLKNTVYGGTWSSNGGSHIFTFSESMTYAFSQANYEIVGSPTLGGNGNVNFGLINHATNFAAGLSMHQWIFDQIFNGNTKYPGSNNAANGGGYWNYNPNVDYGLTAVGSTSDLIGGAALGTAAQLGKGVKGVAAVSKIASGAAWFGIATTGAVAAYEYQTGQANTHTIVDIGVTTTLSAVGIGAVIAVGAVAAAPVVVGAAIVGGIWGIVSASGGSEAIDNWSADWGKKFFYE